MLKREAREEIIIIKEGMGERIKENSEMGETLKKKGKIKREQ